MLFALILWLGFVPFAEGPQSQLVNCDDGVVR